MIGIPGQRATRGGRRPHWRCSAVSSVDRPAAHILVVIVSRPTVSFVIASASVQRKRTGEETAGGDRRIASGTSKAATVRKKQTFSAKEARRMLEQCDIEDLHCDELVTRQHHAEF